MGMNENGSSSEQAAPEGVNWADLAVDVDGDGAFVSEPEFGSDELSSGDPAPAPQDATPAPSPSPQPAESSTPQPAQPQAASPAPATPEVTPPVSQQQPTPAQVDPAELRRQYEEHLHSQYALTEEDAIALVTNPQSVMPKLAANLHMQVMQEVQQHIMQALQVVPMMLQQQTQALERENAAKQEFYGAWPGLSTHHEKVLQNAVLVRQAHPQATKAQVIEMAGVMTAMALGLDPATLRAQPGGVTPPAQQTPQSRIPPRPVATAPSPSGLPQQPQNVFSQFADEDVDWLRGG